MQLLRPDVPASRTRTFGGSGVSFLREHCAGASRLRGHTPAARRLVISGADWLEKYAHNERGEPMPFGLIAKSIKEGQPFIAMTIRAMLGVCYAEKAIYEMSESELTP